MIKNIINIKYIFFSISIFFELVAIFCTQGAVYAQNQMLDKSLYYRYGNNFYADVYAFPNDSFDSTVFYFFYKVAYDELVFKLDQTGKYVAVANVEANFKDADGIIRKRIITNDTIVVANFDESISKSKYFTGFVQFVSITSNYSINIRLLNSKSSQVNSIEKNIKNYKLFTEDLPISDIYFVGDELAQNEYLAFISNSFIPFPITKFSILADYYEAPTQINTSNSNSFEYKITSSKKNNNSRKIWGDFDTISGVVQILKNKKISGKIYNNKPIIEIQTKGLEPENIFYTSNASNTDTNNKNLLTNNNIGLLKIDVNAKNFPPGHYELFLKNLSTNRDTVFLFEVRWADIPLSLLDVNYAIDLMYYILTDEEFKEMKKGAKEEQFRKILAYWNKSFGNANETLYNEHMNTYFNRVDYAFFNFQTITNRDGAKTDRGKIYILHGKPDEITTDVRNGKNSEIWYYRKINQAFIFEVVSVGNYKLVEIEKKDF